MVKFLPLEQVCTQIVDCPHETPKWQDKGIPVIRNFNLIDGQLDMTDGYFVDEETYKKRTRRVAPQCGDIIFSREAPIGNCCIIPENYRCCLGQRLVLLRVNTSICSAEYLLTALLSQFVKKQIDQISKTGSIVSNFAIGDLKKLLIPIIDEYQDIAEFATELNSLISLNNSICSDLEAMAKQLYDYWFVQFDFPDENGKPYKSSGGKMVWNEELKREIPEGWIAGNFNSICSQVNGFPFSSESYVENGLYKLYTIKNVQDGYIEPKTDNMIDNIPPKMNKECLLSTGDIIMSLTGNVGRVGIVFENNALLNQRVLKLKNSLCGKMYLYQTLRNIEIAIKVEKIATGTSQKNLSPIAFGEIPILIPPNKLLVSYNTKFEFTFYHMVKLMQENQQLTSIRDFLLPMLMNGQVKIK